MSGALMISETQYAIITNPAAGKMTLDQKRSALAEAAKILDSKIHGLDTLTADDFTQCTRGLASHCDVLVVAGGDGTLSHVINSIDTTRTVIAYLPLGTGNAMRHALKYKGRLADIAMRIRDGKIREYDLISCDGKKRALMASVGIEGRVIRSREKYLAQGEAGFKTYLKALLGTYFKNDKRENATVTTDESTFVVRNMISLMVVKQPYYGYGMKVVPKARLDDRKLHVLCITSGLFMLLIGGVTAFTIGNRVGKYFTGQKVGVRLERPVELQIDGSCARESDLFNFAVLPEALKLQC